MKRIHLLIYSTFLILNSAFSQSGTWTWISGTDSVNAKGVHGTQGIPSVNNYPRGVYAMGSWKDKQGNFWIYGGDGALYLSDLWKYNPVTNEWTWVKGNGKFDDLPVFGMQGVFNLNNSPGYRGETVATWVDTAGGLWLFSGYNWGSDLWKYDIGTNEWAWITGDTLQHSKGVYGTQGVPGAENTPGSRSQTCSAWTDSLNNLWLFGGFGYDAIGNYGELNDLWKYDISANEWTWMKGADTINAPANYGTQGVPAASNDPGGRWTYTKWKDVQGDFWLMGGWAGDGGSVNDIWKYDLSLNEWIWMDGPDFVNNLGNYSTNCIFNTINIPQSRGYLNASTTDNCGRFWLFGGASDNYGSSNSNFNDLWVFNPEQLEWNWINGTGVPNQTGNYGTMGVSSSSNIPSSRGQGAAWWGNDNRFYMFGGWQLSTGDIYADLWVFTPDTNCVSSSTCNSAYIAPPAANFQTVQTTICANDCISFTDLSTYATSWQWSFSGATDSISTAQNPQNICYQTAGTYNVTLIATNAGGSNWVTFNNYITVNPTPPKPVITQYLNHDTLYCSLDTSYVSYQWYLDSVLIAGATDTLLIISKSGNYNVQVTNKNGCQIAGGINVILGIENYSNDNIISIYPNPASNELTIRTSSILSSEAVSVSVVNILGQVVQQEILKRNNETNINIKNLSAGIYFLEMQNETGRWVGRFVKE